MRLPFPPSDLTGPLGQWANDVWRALSNMPSMSYFSGATPNSVVTGLPGDLTVNVGSASTSSRLWVMGGSVAAPSTTGWNVVRIG
jgi:hypothetical protein